MVPFIEGMRIPQVSIQEGLSVVTCCKLQLFVVQSYELGNSIAFHFTLHPIS